MPYRLLRLTVFVAVLAPTVTFAAPRDGQLFHNEDCTQFFFTQTIAEDKAGEVIDRYVDVMAEAGVTVFLCNTNARRTNYASRVWDPFWGEYDPAGSDDQPFLATIAGNDVASYRRGIDNMLKVHRQGIDYPARVIERCRHHKISPWITLRMDDCHYNGEPDHPFHGEFWKEHPEFQIKGRSDYFAHCLDYAHPEVRDYYMALVVETLDRYDVDGLELDFVREPFVFSVGKESQGAAILTAWIAEVRKKTEAAAARRGHDVRLGVRVPSRPEAAVGLGLDAITWAKRGLIDVLVVTPRWATLEFDMPMERWRERLGDSKVLLAGGLEVNYRPTPAGKASYVTPEQAVGAAVGVLSRGADTVYLFNYFHSGHPRWQPPIYGKTLGAMRSLDTLLPLPRTVGITFRDITAPGEDDQTPLPATGADITLPIPLGPLPDEPRRCTLLVGRGATKDAAPTLSVSVNGVACEMLADAADNGARLVSFAVPIAALEGVDVHQVRVSAADGQPLTVNRLEMSLGGPDDEKP